MGGGRDSRCAGELFAGGRTLAADRDDACPGVDRSQASTPGPRQPTRPSSGGRRREHVVNRPAFTVESALPSYRASVVLAALMRWLR